MILSQNVIKVNWIELYYQYIQEQIMSLDNLHFKKCSISDAVFRCD